MAVYGSTLSAARVAAHYQAGTSAAETTSLEAGAAGLAVPVSNKIRADGAYSIAAAPTFVDYCHLPRRRARSLVRMASTQQLIETAIGRFQDEVPALQKLKLVFGLS